jgi:hypothetical protein
MSRKRAHRFEDSAPEEDWTRVISGLELAGAAAVLAAATLVVATLVKIGLLASSVSDDSVKSNCLSARTDIAQAVFLLMATVIHVVGQNRCKSISDDPIRKRAAWSVLFALAAFAAVTVGLVTSFASSQSNFILDCLLNSGWRLSEAIRRNYDELIGLSLMFFAIAALFAVLSFARWIAYNFGLAEFFGDLPLSESYLQLRAFAVAAGVVVLGLNLLISTLVPSGSGSFSMGVLQQMVNACFGLTILVWYLTNSRRLIRHAKASQEHAKSN